MKTKNHLNIWQRLMCRIFCPRWTEDRPTANDEGPWVAVAILQTHRGEFERDWRLVESNLQNAYEVARWLGLWLADRTSSQLGVRWAVRRPEQGNDKDQ